MFLFLCVLALGFGPAIVALLLGRGASVFMIIQCTLLLFLLTVAAGSCSEMESFSHRDGGGWPMIIVAVTGVFSIALILIVLFSISFLAKVWRCLRHRNSTAVAVENEESNE